MRTDGRRDMTKLIVDFSNFANAPKNWCANQLTVMFWDLNSTAHKLFHLVTTVGSRFTTGLRSRIFGRKPNRRKTVLFEWFKLRQVHGPNKLVT